MILIDLALPERAGETSKTSGMDAAEWCRDRAWFASYPDTVDYCYNSRGFRDPEWPEPELLHRAVWCIGDSFTLGLGVPVDRTWPRLLEAATGRRCINISMDGASNAWISRRAQQIIEQIQPSHMCIQWSFVNRRESPDTQLSDLDRRIWALPTEPAEDVMDTLGHIGALHARATATGTCVLHSFIPAWVGPAQRAVAELGIRHLGIDSLGEVVAQDLARDGFHYAGVTAQALVDQIRARWPDLSANQPVPA